LLALSTCPISLLLVKTIFFPNQDLPSDDNYGHPRYWHLTLSGHHPQIL
jgi:hypothetical protein